MRLSRGGGAREPEAAARSERFGRRGLLAGRGDGFGPVGPRRVHLVVLNTFVCIYLDSLPEFMNFKLFGNAILVVTKQWSLFGPTQQVSVSHNQKSGRIEDSKGQSQPYKGADLRSFDSLPWILGRPE